MHNYAAWPSTELSVSPALLHLNGSHGVSWLCRHADIKKARVEDPNTSPLLFSYYFPFMLPIIQPAKESYQQPAIGPSPGHTKVAGTQTFRDTVTIGSGSNRADDTTDHGSSSIVRSEGGLITAPSHPHETIAHVRKSLPVVRIKLPGHIQYSRFTPVGSPGVSGDAVEVEALKRVLSAEWSRPQWPKSTSIRNRAAISLQHHAFLPIHRLSELFLADCVLEHLDVGVSQKVRCLGLCLRQYEQLPDVDTPVAIVARHQDYRRCSVGAVAFYFVERFQVSE